MVPLGHALTVTSAMVLSLMMFTSTSALRLSLTWSDAGDLDPLSTTRLPALAADVVVSLMIAAQLLMTLQMTLVMTATTVEVIVVVAQLILLSSP